LKRLGLILLAASLVFIPGCALLDMIPGWGSGPGGGTTPGGITAAQIDFSFYGVVTEQGHADDPQWILSGRFPAGNKSASYDPTTHTFTATWDGGGYSNTQMTIRLNATDEFVEYFHARQTLLTLGWWTTYELEGYDILYSYRDGNYRYFNLEGALTHTILTKCIYKSWSSALGSEAVPYRALKGQSVANISSDSTSYIRIRIDTGS